MRLPALIHLIESEQRLDETPLEETEVVRVYRAFREVSG